MNYAKIQIEELEEFKAAVKREVAKLHTFFAANKDSFALTDEEKKSLDPELNGLTDIETDAVFVIDAQIDALKEDIPPSYTDL